MAIRSEFLDRDLTKAEEKEADTNQDGKVSEEEVKAFDDAKREAENQRQLDEKLKKAIPNDPPVQPPSV